MENEPQIIKPNQENARTPETQTGTVLPPANFSKAKGSKYKKTFYIVLVIILVGAGAGLFWKLHSKPKTSAAFNSAPLNISKKSAGLSKAEGLQLDPSKNYGDKYADGILPVGDSKYSKDSAKDGSIYVCNGYAQNLTSDQGGAQARGPWFVNNNTAYDINKKAHVQGSVSWQSQFSNQVTGVSRAITTNDLPNHTTGVFPVASSDPAYAYDRNPNSIKSQSLSYSLSATPKYGDPQCMGGEAGVMLTGVAIFNGFDAGGRDAGAWEVQDSCQGHPQVSGEYHYHTLSSCIKDISVKTVIGFALDGFPITGPQVGTNNILTTADLDECHGITSSVVLDGKTVSTYHYVMTQDFPTQLAALEASPANLQVSRVDRHRLIPNIYPHPNT